MISIDHLGIWANNPFQCAYDLSKRTGIGNADGGFFPRRGLGQKVMPLGGDVYLQINGMVDARKIRQDSDDWKEFEAATRDGDCFVGWCLRTNSIEEFEGFSKHLGIAIQQPSPGFKFRMTGEQAAHPQVPPARVAWGQGMPNMYHIEDLAGHSSALAVQEGTAEVTAQGVTWLELGGSEGALKSWLGDLYSPGVLGADLRFNGNRPGLYGVGIMTNDGERSIRLIPRPLA